MRTIRALSAVTALVAVVAAGCSGSGAPVGDATPVTEQVPAISTSVPVTSTSVASAPVTTTAPAVTSSPADNSQSDFSCDIASDGVPVCEGRVPASVGKYRTPRQEIERQQRVESDAALRAYVAQTGTTREQCIADAKAGNAS